MVTLRERSVDPVMNAATDLLSLLLASEWRQVLQQLVQEVRRAFCTDLAVVTLQSGDEGHQRVWAGPLPDDLSELPLDCPPCLLVMDRVQPLVVEDLQEAGEEYAALRSAGMRFYAGVPLVTSDGNVLGALCILGVRPAAFGEEQRLLLTALARNVSGRLELAMALAREQGAREEEERRRQELERILHLSQDMIIAMGADGVFRAVNPACRRILGYEPAELIGRPYQDLIHPDDVEPTRAAWNQIAAGGRLIGFQSRYRRRDGRYIWLEWSVTADPAEGVFYCVARDITDAKEQERLLQESNDRFRSLFEYNPVAVLALDRDGRCTAINPACERLLGYREEQLVGSQPAAYLNDADVEAARALYARALQGEAADGLEISIPRRDGSQVEVSVTAVPVRVQGEVAGVYVMLQDITETRRSARTMRFLAETSRALASSLDYSAALRSAAQMAVAEIADWCTVDVVGEDGEIELLVAVHRDPVRQAALLEAVRRHKNAQCNRREVWNVLRTGKPLLLPEVTHEMIAQTAVDEEHLRLRREVGFQSLMIVPLVARGRILGALSLVSADPNRRYGPVDLAVAEELARTAALAVDNALLYQEAERKAYHDALTGLPNRTYFTRRLEEALARSAPSQPSFAVLFIDLDGFKIVNDSLGHGAGDRLLVETAHRLSTCVREHDVVARLGGDEFTILLREINDTDDAVRVAEGIIDALQTPFLVDGHEFVVTPSIGLVMGNQGRSVDELLRYADIAMYQAKRAGKACYHTFMPLMDQKAMGRLVGETELRRAVKRKEFTLHYQPIFNLETGGVVGVEALVRWQHPERGLVLPGEFIPLAEETGLIQDIGRWVLRAACHQVRAWEERGLIDRGLRVAVNVSPRQLLSPDLVAEVRSILGETGLDPEQLELEVTESVLIQQDDLTRTLLQDLKGLGVCLALDDFGTGYSSLSYLHRFPFDILKLDQSFVRGLGQDPQAMALGRAIIMLADALGLRVTAEGVETAEQIAWLQKEGVSRGQGFYLGRPLSAAAFVRWLSRSRNGARKEMA